MNKGTKVKAVRDISEYELFHGNDELVSVPKNTEGIVRGVDSAIGYVDVEFDTGHQVWVVKTSVVEIA